MLHGQLHQGMALQLKPSIDKPDLPPSLLIDNASFLYSQKLKQTLLESKKAFLNLHFDDEKEDVQMEEKSIVLCEQRKPSKKISFKVKKTPSLYRTKQTKIITMSTSTVAELTSKFNELVAAQNSKSKVTRKSSIKNKRDYNLKVIRKPSLKAKPSEALINRRNTTPSKDPKCIRAKITYLETPQAVPKLEEQVVRPTSLNLDLSKESTEQVSPNVKAKIDLFEAKTSPVEEQKKPKVPENKPVLKMKPLRPKTDVFEEEVQVITIPAMLPQRRCDSMYETLNLRKVTPVKNCKSEEVLSNQEEIKPNSSFLWRNNSIERTDKVGCKLELVGPEVPPRLPKKPAVLEEDVYEELSIKADYEYLDNKYEDVISEAKKKQEAEDDGYEYCASVEENVYEVLPTIPSSPRRLKQEPLPPPPPPSQLYGEAVSNCYESIYNEGNPKTEEDAESNYESIYGVHIQVPNGSNRNSVVSSDQQSNSLYGRTWDEQVSYAGKATSDLSTSDRSDDWVDVTDYEDTEKKPSEIIIIQEKQPKVKKSGWSEYFRTQSAKASWTLHSDPGLDSDNSDHHYEMLYGNNEEFHCDDYDSFESDSDSNHSSRNNLNDSGLDIGNSQLPDPPNSQSYVLTRLAATAGKHMRKLRRNWSLTRNDISKSLSRMTKKKSRTDLDAIKKEVKDEDKSHVENQPYQNVEFQSESEKEKEEKTKSLNRKGFLNKFRRSMSMTSELASEITTNLTNKQNRSTFYLTETIDIDDVEKAEEACPDSGVSLSPVPRHVVNKNIPRPQSPPPPAPINQDNQTGRKEKRSSSWYAEVGLFKNETPQVPPRKANTFWYAEVGLYQSTPSTPSTSSAENSGNTKSDFINQDNNEEYYNMKNSQFSNSTNSLDVKNDIQERLRDEPLYQFYAAAVVDSACQEGISDSDNYEEVNKRPSAMEIVSPKKNSGFSKTLWCEIPEVVKSAALSGLSIHQKKLQEAKFEIFTSEASYLNSLNVLFNNFVISFKISDVLSKQDWDILFGKVEGVKDCSEMLIQDLDKCWQSSIFLAGICDVVLKHARDHFQVYVSYCENQTLIMNTLNKNKENPGFVEMLNGLQSNSACQSLSLYSFLMLPMQRITRWPLLLDAVLKRLSQDDEEYESCQYALATLNKIVNQCNEAARKKESQLELKKIASQLEFSKGMAPIEIVKNDRWLIKSGQVSHIQTKMTFSKKFAKVPLQLFLFNDLLCVCKPKSDNNFLVLHHCPKNLVEISSDHSQTFKETQIKHSVLLSIIENQEGKTVEFVISCGSETDKERWAEALLPPRAEDPNEVLYESWDCPQVRVTHDYTASQPDEITICRGDVINVLRKMADGWYQGERLTDGQTGWFPANYTEEIVNPHVRARNLKQRYRLLAFSENYLKNK